MDLHESGWMVRGTLVRCALSILRSSGSSVRSRTQARGIGLVLLSQVIPCCSSSLFSSSVIQVSSVSGKPGSSSDTSTRDAPVPLLAVRSITIPVVSGIINVSVLRHFQFDASLVGRSVPALALPAGTVRRFGQVTVRRHVDGNASHVDPPIPTAACPSVTSGRVQIGIRRYVEGDASLVDFPITPTALPTPSVGRIGRVCEVCVGGHFESCAATIDLSIAPTCLRFVSSRPVNVCASAYTRLRPCPGTRVGPLAFP